MRNTCLYSSISIVALKGGSFISSELGSFVHLKVTSRGSENHRHKIAPKNINFGLEAADISIFVKPSDSDTSRKEVTMPTEFIIYCTELYCVRSEYSGATTGSMATWGTVTRVSAVL